MMAFVDSKAEPAGGKSVPAVERDIFLKTHLHVSFYDLLTAVKRRRLSHGASSCPWIPAGWQGLTQSTMQAPCATHEAH